MSTLRHGKIERAIAAEIADAPNSDRFGRIGPVHIRSDQLVDEVYCPEDVRHGWNWADWKPTPGSAEGGHPRHAELRRQTPTIRSDGWPRSP